MKIRVLLLSLLVAVASVAPAQTMGRFKAKVKPSRAGIFVDGKYLGPAGNFGFARTYDLPVGEHEILLTEPRYQDITKKVTITAGQTTTINEKMSPVPAAKPPFGVLRVTHPDKFAAVFLNNKFYGHIDEFSNFAQGIKLNPGEYELKVTPSKGGADFIQKFTITADKTTLVEAK